MDKLVSLCKGRGFIFAGSEIYGGLANTWDYGPLGVELKNNVKRAWWKKFVQENPYNIGVDSTITTHDEAKLVCDVFNQASDVIKAEGIATGFGYHNHNMEFNRVATKEQQEKMKGNPFAAFMKVGDQIYDLMLKDTDPGKVYFEMDVYWTVMGQNDPVEYMQKHADRIKVLHIKDRAVFGQSGMMNFEMIFKQMYANGIKDYFVELERMPDGRTQFAGVKDCADYLIKAPFVK